MENLNELPQAFYGVIQDGKVVMLPTDDGQWLNKTSVAEAFLALEQRAEAAEHERDCHMDIAEHFKARCKELEKQEESRWNTHDGIARPIGVHKDDLVYLRMKRQEIKLPYPAGMVNWKHDGGEFDVIAWASVYSSPAPAADLADLISRVVDSGALTSPEHEEIEAECCSILRNIEEKK